ncbi:helix-turn-helix domain-containing protein [Citrobacter sp. NCU1]|uniref:helix-turn-helix domain-containing protein n=1 Tax=Citrobacter sp. NCU1 TaxID=2026683 RepID=UPI001390EE4E|nr:helix-turn-helix domain-containing protein [Citrobacter sp. NCU1]NDO83313.1 helix-turn-helix domain-containing protein [Citrobacter sp. NCU1]
MSNKLTSYVWDGCAASGMKLPNVAVMARLADWCNDDGVCWPSVETIARQTGAGISTVRKAIAQLEEDGWLTRKQRRKGNRNASNVYQLNVGKLYAAARPHQAQSDAPESDPSECGGSNNSKSEDFHPPQSDASKYDQSKSDPSEYDKKEGFHPPQSGGDPSVNSNTDPSDKKIAMSENSGEFPDGENSSPVPEPIRKGKWGTQEDHQCAEWIFSRIKKLYEKAAETDGEVSRPKDPNWNTWANEIRLMRAIDGRSHRQICELFKRVQSDSFWCKNVLSPSKLREKWDELSLKLSPVNVSHGSVIDADFDDEYYQNDLAAAARSGFRV